MFQTRMLHVFRTGGDPGSRLAVVIGATGGLALEQAGRLADAGFDLVIAGPTSDIFLAGSTLTRNANRVTALTFESASIDDAERLLDVVGDRAVEMLLIHGDGDASGTRHLIETMTETMRLSGRGRILVDGSETFCVV
ncbi:MAG: hypothetical protein KF889_17525 [Alphaproteobacteria bacterium]|nr:hypothetical protein [Alphaproteobacteria bacterium]MCW5739830.1 hypothetical protein [Alphaproteobacteria bacterium]